MSVLSDVFTKRISYTNEVGYDNEEKFPLRQNKLARLGYDPHFVKSYQEKISQARSEDERIVLAAQLAHSRSNGRHLGPSITIDYSPQKDNGYDYPGRNALAWLSENGHKYGVCLRPTK